MLNFKKISVTLLVCTLFTYINYAQIGIGTSTPEGALDLESSTQGLVYPRIALTASNVSAPVTNPNGGSIVSGTVVFNTNLTTNGANDVSPGVYAWSGAIWLPQFTLTDRKKYEQTSGCQRTTIRESHGNPEPTDSDDVAGLNSQTFTPKYSGIYRIEVKTNFAAGEIDPFTSSDKISLATSEGSFFFKLSGTGVDIDPASTYYDYSEGWLYTHSYASDNTIESPTLVDDKTAHFASLLYYQYLLANNTYTFNLSNCINTGHAYFVNNGDSGNGQGHIGHSIPCSVEFEFVK
ncbi:hypothetical protein BXY75_2470 [Ulvibacter antarcticus]|uniref:Uncharacterized protein n=1 Tax=Ulvibacter antarcticus TaxID=442714 RepID=A0A3L9YAC0_9FLAO|nr:hypothetical protein BXY75_2470 [Ulvibacter antarcticus]